MSLLATLALAASVSTTALPHCSWDKPGVNPFMGDVVSAVDRYQDIPAATRAKLKARMQARAYDDMVDIRRDGIDGKARYGAEIRDMHFGQGGVCTTVSRKKWTDQTVERGLVYCEDGQCILVPTVCRNVSRIKRLAPAPVAVAPARAANVAAASREVVEEAPFPLDMEPTGAGMPAGNGEPTSFAQMSTPGLSGLVGGSSPGGTSSGPSPIPQLGGTPPLPPGTIPTGVDHPVTTPVPEPGTWVMMLAGLLAVIWIARRRA